MLSLRSAREDSSLLCPQHQHFCPLGGPTSVSECCQTYNEQEREGCYWSHWAFRKYQQHRRWCSAVNPFLCLSCSFLHFTGTCKEATCLCCLAFSLPSSLMGLFSAWWFRVLMRPRLCLVGGRKQVSFHVVWLPVHFYVQMSAFLDQGDQAIVLHNSLSELLVVHGVDMCCECL